MNLVARIDTEWFRMYVMHSFTDSTTGTQQLSKRSSRLMNKVGCVL